MQHRFYKGILPPKYKKQMQNAPALIPISSGESIPGELLLSRAHFRFDSLANFKTLNYIYNLLKKAATFNSKPIYLFDRNQRKVVKKGNIHVRQLTGDLVINESEDYLEIYYKGNNGSSIFFSENTPSLAEGWKIKK